MKPPSNQSGGCETITKELLLQIYGDAIFEPFTDVFRVDGTVCVCDSGLCNLPDRDKTITKPGSGAERPVCQAVLPMLSFLCWLLI